MTPPSLPHKYLITDSTLTSRKLLSSTNSFQQLTYNASGVATYQTNKSTCINRVIFNYTGGAWGSPSTYTWVPGLHYDYTPVRADSLIKWSANFSVYWNDSNYGIMSQYFYWNGVIRHALVSGFLSKDIENYGLLKLTKKGKAIEKDAMAEAPVVAEVPPVADEVAPAQSQVLQAPAYRG